MDIKQTIHTEVFHTSKRGCQISVSGSDGMFSLKIGSMKRDNGSMQSGTDFHFYTEELDAVIDALAVFKEKQFKSKIV